MNILISISRQYIFPAKALLRSIAENNSGKIQVYIAHNSFTEKDINRFNAFAAGLRGCEMKINFIRIESGLVKRFSRKWYRDFPPEIFFRIIALYYLPESVDRILYLDADIITDGSLSELYAMKLDGKILAAVKDAGYIWEPEVNAQRRKTLGLDSGNTYVNAGMLLIDVKRFVGEHTLEHVMNTVGEYGERLYFADQDLINLLFQGKIKVLTHYRYTYFAHGSDRGDTGNLPDGKPVIYHYFGGVKPWDWRCVNRQKRFFWKYARHNGGYGKYFSFLFKTATLGTARNIARFITERKKSTGKKS